MSEETTTKRGGVKAALLGDVSARDAAANARLDRKFRKRRMQRDDNEGERDFKKRRRAERRKAIAAGIVKTARTAVVVGPITAPMAVAWSGQIGFATSVLAWPFAGGVLYAAAYELTTVFCGWLYHEARKDGDGGFIYRLAMWIFALGAAAQQWWHYLNPDGSASYRSVTFATMTLVGVIVFELFARLVHRRTLRRAGKVDDSRPRFGWLRWARYPRRTFDAWSLTVQHPTRFNTVEAAWTAADTAAVQRQRQKIARGLLRTEQDPAWSGGSHLTATQDPAAGTFPKRKIRAGWHGIGRRSGQIALPEPQDPGRSAADPLRTEQDPAAPTCAPHKIRPGSDLSGPQDPALDAAQPGRELEAGRTSEPDLVNPGPDLDQTSDADEDEFKPTNLERQAVALLVQTRRSFNRSNCADAVRELDGAISTARAAKLAAWGRDHGGPTQLRSA